MAFYSYEMKLAFNQSSGLTNLESIFATRTIPRGQRVPIGATSRITLSGKRITDGQQFVTVRFDYAKFSELTTYITTFFTTWGTENVEATLKTRNRDGTFVRYNVIAHLPLEGIHYTHPARTDAVIDLQLPFYIVGVAS